MLCLERIEEKMPAQYIMEDLNEREKSALRNFRMRISDLDLGWYYGHNSNLVRWLRARDLNVDKAEFMLRKHLEWRKAEQIDSMLEREVPDFMLNEFPFEIPGLDEDGDIVAVIPYGRWDFRELVERGQKHELLNYVNYIFALAEKFVMQRSSQEKIYNKIILVLDLEGFAMKQILHKPTIEFLLGLMRTLEDNYPEILKIGVLVNSPKIFEILWAIAKPMMTARTLSKVEIYGCNPHSWKPKLLDHIPGGVLPSKYGGGNTTSRGHLYYYSQILESLPNDEFKVDLLVNKSIPENDLKAVVVESGSKFTTVVNVPAPGYTLRWEFKTLDNDIGFSVTNAEEDTVAQIRRADAHKVNQQGKHICKASGPYTFTFDNSFSRFFSKRLHYAIVVEEP